MLAGALLALPAQAQNPPPYDLAAMVECRGTTVADYNGLAIALAGDEARETREALGLTEEKSHNTMLAEFSLKTPLTVFGRQTSRLAFNSAGVFAILDEADPHPLAKELGVTAVIDRPSKFMAEKILSETDEELEDSGIKIHAKVSLNVSTVDSHPGKLLAGCGYRMETE
jgi:hypothetical protein